MIFLGPTLISAALYAALLMGDIGPQERRKRRVIWLAATALVFSPLLGTILNL